MKRSLTDSRCTKPSTLQQANNNKFWGTTEIFPMIKENCARTIHIQHIREGIFQIFFGTATTTPTTPVLQSNWQKYAMIHKLIKIYEFRDSEMWCLTLCRRMEKHFSLNNSSSQFLCIWTSIQKPTTRTWLVVATWLVVEEGSITAADPSWELCPFCFIKHHNSAYFRSGQVFSCSTKSCCSWVKIRDQKHKVNSRKIQLKNKITRGLSFILSFISNSPQRRNTYSY
jgi:hypothetical protein